MSEMLYEIWEKGGPLSVKLRTAVLDYRFLR